MEEELTKATALFDEHKSVAKEKGRELGIKQMSAMKDKIRDLKSILKDFDSDTNSSNDAVTVARCQYGSICDQESNKCLGGQWRIIGSSIRWMG